MTVEEFKAVLECFSNGEISMEELLAACLTADGDPNPFKEEILACITGALEDKEEGTPLYDALQACIAALIAGKVNEDGTINPDDPIAVALIACITAVVNKDFIVTAMIEGAAAAVKTAEVRTG